MIASDGFKHFAQSILPDANGLSPDLRIAISEARRASINLSDKLFILENLLEEAEEEGLG